MREIDPITLEVITEGLISVVREMRATVFRTARSVAIHEARDFSCGLFDPAGQVVAQSEDIGSHVVPLPWSVEEALKEIGDTLAVGDVIMMNDPYRQGTHLNDVTIVYPIFRDGRLVFLPAVREHWADVGGAVPGSMSGTATEIYQEGIRIPPVKIVEAGRQNHALMEVLLSNMRVRADRLGDFNSGLAACRTAERRIDELVARYGMETLQSAVERNLDRSEARMREKIRTLPDGEYYYEDYLETFTADGFTPLLLPITMTINGDRLTADFKGVSPQVAAPVNSTLAVSAASVLITLKSVLDPGHALNHGSFRPVEVIAPPATIVNVTHPAPAGSHGEIRKRVVAVMLGALSGACPDLVSADIHRTSFHNLIGGVDPASGNEYVHYEWSSGGNGGFAEADGPSAMAAIDWGDLSTVQPTEVLEVRYPLHVEWSRLGLDSGGPGTRRGGLGMRRSLRLTRGEARYSLLADGAVMPPFGILGGDSGGVVESYVVRADGSTVVFASPGKVGGQVLEAGDAVVLQSAGGGGYGDPLERDSEAVAADVRDDMVSEHVARHMYGVLLTAKGEVDRQGSEALRERMRATRIGLTVVPDDGSPYSPSGPSRRRVVRLNPADIRALGLDNGDRVELVGAAAPLRGWIRPDDEVPAGSVPVDRLGLLMLGSENGTAVVIRPLSVPRVRPSEPGSARRAQ